MMKKGIPKSDPQTLYKNSVKSLNNQGKNHFAKKNWPLTKKCVLFLSIIAFCIYANTLQNGYALDDGDVIQNNELVKKGVAAIPEILFTPYHYGEYRIKNGPVINDLYRPLSLVMFAIEYQLFKDNPFAGHLINVLLYAGCVMLFFFFLYQLFKKKRPITAFIGALLFALHPIHTEVVANIKSRDELLCFFFGFLSINTFIKYVNTEKKIYLYNGLVFYFLSLLSKETSITLLVVIPLIFFFYRNENRKRSIYISLLPLVPVLIYLVIRYSVLITTHVYSSFGVSFYENALIAAPSFASRLATEILILGYYIKLLVIPYPLVCDYAYNAIPYANFSDIWVWLSLIVYVLFIYFGMSRLIKKINDPLAFGILFFLITISLFSNILFLLKSEMAERFLFFPSAGFCLIAAFVLERLVLKSKSTEIATIKNKGVLFFLVPISLLFIYITIDRNTDWKDNLTLFRADTKKSPNNFRLYFFMATAEIDLSNKDGIDPTTKHQILEKGIIDYRKSLAIYPNYSETHKRLALAFLNSMQLDSAEVHAKKAIMNAPDDDDALNTLAGIYFNKQKFAEAIQLYKKASIINPRNSDYLCNIGACNASAKQYDSAIYYFRKSIIINPVNSMSIKFIAMAFNTTGQKDSAKKYEAIAKQSEPGFSVDNNP